MPDMNRTFHLMASATALGNRRGEVMIYSGISRYSYGENDPTVTSNKFDKELKKLADVDEITIRINSPGGSVSEATAIRTMLEKHPAKKTIDIEGMCASAATIIACMPGVKVRMAKGGDYMIHRCSMIAWGHADAMLSAYNSMKNTDTVLAGYYAERTGKTEEECLELMKAETWYNGEGAKEAGFVDEIIGESSDEEDITASTVNPEMMSLMSACYAHVPDHIIKAAQAAASPADQAADDESVSNETSAVAADSSTENNHEGVNSMDELRNATAEQLQQENPTVAQTIANDAVSQERNRIKRINALTRKGEKWQAMAKKAIEDGTSVEDYIEAIIAEENKAASDYMESRQRETAQANHVGGGDAEDNDDGEAKQDKLAKELAKMADDAVVNVSNMF